MGYFQSYCDHGKERQFERLIQVHFEMEKPLRWHQRLPLPVGKTTKKSSVSLCFLFSQKLRLTPTKEG